MKDIFGPQTRRLLAFLNDLQDLSAEEVDLVTSAWKQVRGLDRAEAWAQLHRVTTTHERYPILAAASAARREAMDTARKLHRPDWAFWAAAWDAAAAITADDLICSESNNVLTAPLATVMPSLAQGRSGADEAEQRPSCYTPPGQPASAGARPPAGRVAGSENLMGAAPVVPSPRHPAQVPDASKTDKR